MYMINRNVKLKKIKAFSASMKTGVQFSGPMWQKKANNS